MSNHSNGTTQSNSTAGSDDVPIDFLSITQILCYCAISFVGILANVVICVGLSRGRRKSSEYFILNLASADLLVCAIGIPLDIYQHYAGSWPYGAFLCHVVYPSQTLLILISILTLMGMSLERHRAICSPLKRRLSSKWIRGSILFIWLIAIAAVVPYAKALKYTEGDCVENWAVQENAKYYTLALFIIDYCIPLTIISYCYTRAGYVLHKKFKQFSSPRCNSVKQNLATMKRLKQNKKVVKIFSSAVILFVICVLPGDCYWMWYSFRKTEYHPYDNHLQAFSTIMLYANSAINPFIFGACQMVCHRNMKSRFSDQLTSTTGLSRSKGSASSVAFGEGLNSRNTVRKHNVKYTSLNRKNDTKDDTRQHLDNVTQGLRETKLRFRGTKNAQRETNQAVRDTTHENPDTNIEMHDTKQAQRKMSREQSDATTSECRSNETLNDIRSISSDSDATLHREGEDDTFSISFDTNETAQSTNYHSTNCHSTNCQFGNGIEDTEEKAQKDLDESPATNTKRLSSHTESEEHDTNELSTLPEEHELHSTENEFQNSEQRKLEAEVSNDTNKDKSSELNENTDSKMIEIPYNIRELMHSNYIKETDL